MNGPFCELLEDLGFENVKALLATGNVVFDAKAVDARAIEHKVEPAFVAAFGRPIDFIARDAAGWEKLVKANPFAGQSSSDPSHVAVRVMRSPISDAAIKLIEDRATDNEIVKIVGGDPWVYFGAGIARSPLGSVMTAKRIGAGTSRNWNTVKKIAAVL